MLPRFNKTIVARCDWGAWVLYTLGGKWHPRPRLGCTKCIVYCKPSKQICQTKLFFQFQIDYQFLFLNNNNNNNTMYL